jgi:hypothetical protein
VFTKKTSTLVEKGRALLQIKKKGRVSLGQGRALRPYFTLETLNDSILKFPFCRMDKSNKPTTLPKVLRTFKVKQSDMVFGKVSTFNRRGISKLSHLVFLV